MYVVGCTGGIGAGKSTVARLLAVKGATVLDADVFARAALAPGGRAVDAVREAFGEKVVATDGATIDRQRLASIVFADPARRSELEAIIHPIVREEMSDALAGLSDSDTLVVLDVPLLIDASGERRFDTDALVVVDAPEEEAIERLLRDRAMDPDAIRSRIAAQAPRDARYRHADYLIMNLGTLEELEEMVGACWTWLTTRREESHGER